ncbi:alpha-hydroxy-acid oxidizing protein [Pseudomonas sp. TH39(2020)]|uniref:alpha-hydroxy acid oxidase n=1 Tax=Pseudomonas sp. TH39(2020) TaxID=2796349 RepID=UPI001913DCD7|nr:alpha-hydroxy acid oxidase [Pseudomonas sp. TH39(2020)]MBK5401428.1 alpha-hydroxy-acid oxidizing protein [Pseudomonas sp. TH39(2020)]
MTSDTTTKGVGVQSDAPIAVNVPRPVTTIPHRFRDLLALDDFERHAKRHLPTMVFHHVCGGVETETALRGTRDAYRKYRFVPRMFVDVSGRKQDTTLFGHTFSHPFGVGPLGGAAFVAYRGDLVLTGAAKAMNVPMILSASSLISLEDVIARNPQSWFQAYLPGDPKRIDPLIDRVENAGYKTLVITGDLPVLGNREHVQRSGFSMPIKVTPKVMWQSAMKPNWLFGTVLRTVIQHGMPHFENTEALRGPAMMSNNVVRNTNARDQLDWTHIEAIRKRWKGNLVLKGILSAEDARVARDLGVDGIIVSNHGGRQLDYAVAPLDVLAEIAEHKGAMKVMIDSGIRRGTDVLKAMALGADFVFLGRSFLYAAAIGGEQGVLHAMRILKEEIDRDMALVGVRRLHQLHPDLLRRVS